MKVRARLKSDGSPNKNLEGKSKSRESEKVSPAAMVVSMDRTFQMRGGGLAGQCKGLGKGCSQCL